MADSLSEPPGDVIGVEEATVLLEVTQDRVQVMIDGGLLNPIGRPGELLFYRGEVIAARELGMMVHQGGSSVGTTATPASKQPV